MKDERQVKQLVSEAYQWIQKQIGQESLDFTNHKKQAQAVLDQISEITVSGVELLLERIYDEIGFDQFDSPLFKPLVLSRIESSFSKLKTTDYLFKYHSMSIDVEAIYRYMDKLYNKQKEKVQQISYDHTREILGEDISMVFYVVTTLYFEIEKEDELRKSGFSKDGKHQPPQIVLGLLVSVGGYPLAYDIFEGNKYEGYTMLPIIENFEQEKGTIYENDFYTELISKMLLQLSEEEKKNILIIDDLDRVDPKHIFRLLNVFAAHFDVQDDKENKFGFDQIIFVCDINKYRKTLLNLYGEIDFGGYIDKFIVERFLI